MKLKKLINEDAQYFGNKQDELNQKPVTLEEKKAFLERIQNFSDYGGQLKGESDLVKLSEELKNMVNIAERIILSETDGWFDGITIKRNTSEMRKISEQIDKTARETKSLQERLYALYEDLDHIMGRYFETKKPEPKYDETQLHGEQPNTLKEGRNWDNDEVEKIARRQMDAIDKFGFLTKQQLMKFCDKADKDDKLVAQYFKLSSGFTNDAQHKAVSQKLANFIKKNI